MDAQEQIVNLVAAARLERSGDVSYRLYDTALRLCEDWENASGDTQALSLRAQILSEMVHEENSPKKRVQRWNQALSILEASLNKANDPTLAIIFSSIAVDAYQDKFSSLTFDARRKHLRSARAFIETALKTGPNDSFKANLLARKSSLLRHLALYELSAEGRVNRFKEAVRCAELALTTSRQSSTLVESALCLWAWARYERVDEKYFESLREVEKRLKDELVITDEISQLTLARFYRLTYRHLEACQSYLNLTKSTRQVRRLLRDSYLYGESAVQLQYASYPLVTVDKHVTESRALIERGIAAGYKNARLIIVLAHLAAIKGGSSDGSVVLSDIDSGSGTISWQRVVELVTTADLSEPTTYGLALGIDQSSVWTSLASFSNKYLSNNALTRLFYETAVKLDNTNAIALTNFARFLIFQGDEKSLVQAERLLQRAQGFSDRRFVWWRVVMALLNDRKKKSQFLGETTVLTSDAIRSAPQVFRNLQQIRERFHLIERLDDTQRRGYELEILIYGLASLSVEMASPPYRLIMPEGGTPQVDGFFQHQGCKYRVECKWEKGPIEGSDIDVLKGKLDVIGVDGLFVSMNGFTTAAIGRAARYRNEKCILLVNGDEARFALNLQINFDELVMQKRLHFDQRSDPYYVVTPVSEAV